MANYRYEEWIPSQTGINAAALSAAPTSNEIAVNGADLIEFVFIHVNTSGALNIDAALTTIFRDPGLGGTSEPSASARTTSFIAAGVDTVSPHVMRRAVTGSASWTWAVEVNGASHAKLAFTAVGAATDKITVYARVRLPC